MVRRGGYALHQTIHESERSLIIRATRLKDECPVLLKFPVSDYLDRRRILELRREYAISRRVEGDGIVRVLGLEEFPDRPGLVLEDFGGASLSQVLKQRVRLDVETFLDFALRITTALGHIHRKSVIHKDIKPHNIIVNPQTGVLKLTDFSLSVALAREVVSPESLTHLRGTLAYMAPEQTGRMNRAVDSRADFYALGATFFEMLTGRHVFPTSVPLELLHAHVAQLPCSPQEVVAGIPSVLADIVLKLLAKDPEDRYQSAAGLIADLEKCRLQLQEGTAGRTFTLGSADRSQGFQLPQGLYGRASDIELLTELHARAAAGRCQLLLITGSAGIGKSSLVNELHRTTVASQGRFASGKCDQLHRGVPFDAVLQALRHLVRQTQTEEPAQVAFLRERLLETLGSNAGVLVEAVPDSRALLGEQPPVVPLPANSGHGRLSLVLARAIQAFAMPGQPLVLFLDDLQWADSATLGLVQTLAHGPDSHHLLLVGAYRDVEVSETHPLSLMLNELSASGTPPQTLYLAPLGPREVAQLVGDVTGASEPQALELGSLIHTRTGGNPFVVKEFLRFLYEQGLLRASSRGTGWEWDFSELKSQEIPEDAAGLMAVELRRLPPDTVELLQLASCLGVVFGFRDLTIAHGATSAETARVLWSAIERGLVLPLSPDYLLLDPHGDTVSPDFDVPLRFLHDRVRQAAYTLSPEAERATCHVRTGLRLYEDARAAGKLEERAFTFLPHLGHGLERIAPDMRLELADLHLRAGQRAKASGSYRTACELFRAGSTLLPASPWEHEHDRSFALHLEYAESSSLAGDFEVASTYFETLRAQANTPAQRAMVLGLRAQLAALNNQYAEALELSLEGLRMLGVECPASLDMAQLSAQRREVSGLLKGREVAELLQLPRLNDPQVALIHGLLAAAVIPTYFVAQHALMWLALQLVKLSLEHGNSRFSPYGYVLLGFIHSSELDDPFTGQELGQLAIELTSRFQDPMAQAHVRFVHSAFINHWVRGSRTSVELLTAAYKDAMEGRDWKRVAHCLIVRASLRLSLGDPLPELLEENQKFLELLKPFKDHGNLTTFRYLQQTVLMLTGAEKVPEHSPDIQWPLSHAYQAVLLTEQHYLMGRPKQALESAEAAMPWLVSVTGQALLVTHAFYHAMSAAAVSLDDPRTLEPLLAVIEKHLAYLEKCAHRAPENYAPHHLLVRAEFARVRRQEQEALQTYEEAIAAARESRLPNMEALACQQACSLQVERGRRPHAYAYLLEALNACERWGAYGKVNQLLAEHASLLRTYGGAAGRWGAVARLKPAETGAGATSESRNEMLDMTSVMKASQTISSELQFSQLVANLISIVMESAGAQRGVLVLKREQDFFVEAVAEVGNRDSPLMPSQPVALSDALCHAIAHQVLRTGATVVLDDACVQEPFRTDVYISQRGVRSVLCAPIFHRKHLLGLFYLENNLAAGAFNGSRLEVLGILSAQAAISIENAALYRELEEHSLNLERRVTERTDQLHLTNAQLRHTLETLKTINAQILTQEKLASLGVLTAGIAHELRNPLNFMSNFAELSLELLQELAEDLGGDTELPSLWRERLLALLNELTRNSVKVCEHGHRATSIIDGMLRHARTHQGERNLTDINQLVDEAVRFIQHGLRSQTPKVEVTIETELDFSVPPLPLAAEDIRRVILNLLDNGCYAAHHKGRRLGPASVPRVKVSTRWTGSEVEMRIRDNGEGIPPAVRDRLFTPFFTTKPPGKGTGLGLSISHDIIVVTHGGTLRVESEEGQYAEFILTLPGEASLSS
ncbi:Predicted ATPase [Stigmatella aurantiaca]|uniref:histidine kinase n=2 Tax=Stigmatella aurantiaca TaxID=41 RepID=A0A1H7VCC0_STIAU|nr:Predicted ATPase [Stigmatella aurantiaca]